MCPLNEAQLRKQLESEGFAHTFVWQDGPRAHYPNHTHAGLTAHVILDGEMTLTMAENRKRIEWASAAMFRRERFIRRRWGRRAAGIW